MEKFKPRERTYEDDMRDRIADALYELQHSAYPSPVVDLLTDLFLRVETLEKAKTNETK